MSESEAPKIEFPCAYPVKVLGRNNAAFRAVVLAVFERHAPGFDQAGVVLRDSRKGTFTSMTVTIRATGQTQLEALHRDLMATGHVHMVI